MADLTLEGALTSVGPHVPGHFAFMRKRLVANLTSEGKLSNDLRHVAGQVLCFSGVTPPVTSHIGRRFHQCGSVVGNIS